MSADTGTAGHQVGDLRTFDPYGQPLTVAGAVDNQNVPDNSPGSMDYGWLGQYQRPYEHAGALSLVQMGARPYSPLLGRFLSVDPVDGGSASDYDYVAGDPINAMDLDGHGWFSSIVSAVTKIAEKASWIPGPIGTIASGVASVGNAIQGNWGAAARYGAQALAGVVTAGIGSAAVGLAFGAYKAYKFARGVGRIIKAAKRSKGMDYKGVHATFRQSRVAGRIWVGRGATKTVTKRGSVRWVSKSGHRQYRSPENKGRRGWQSNFESGRVNGKYTNNYHVRHRR